MGVCTSTKKKDVKANTKIEEKKDKEKENADSLDGSKSDKESKNEKEKDEEKKEEKKEENKEENKDSNFSEESDKDSSAENKNKKKEKEKEKEKNKNNNKKEEEDEDNDAPDITINYLNNGKAEFQQVFKTNDNISSLFDILLEKKGKYAEYDLITNKHLSLSTQLNEKIDSIFPEEESANVSMKYLGLDISNDIKSDYEKLNKVLGLPLFDLGQNIGLLIFHINEKNFTTEIIKNNKLSKFNHLSSICNANNNLYLSGGDNNDRSKPTNFFTSVDLLNIDSINELPILNIARSWHSMIFIPKKYIYIVGGNTNDVELYDIDKKSIIIDSKMNEIRNESTLFIMNNSMLYSFCGLSSDGSFLSTVERCNLRQKERKWSYVNYSTADNTLFEECFYIGCFFSETSLILFSANEDESNEFANILFDLEYEDNPTLVYYESGGKIVDVVPEKTFHPIGQNTFVMIPLVGTKVKIYKVDDALKLNVEEFPDVLKPIME